MNSDTRLQLTTRSVINPQYPAGTILLYERHGFRPIPRIIRLVEGNKFVHVAMVLDSGPDYCRVIQIDTNTHGIEILSYEASCKKGIPMPVMLPTGFVDSGLLHNEAKKLVSTSTWYDYPLILELSINHFIGRIKGFFNKTHEYKRYFSKQIPERWICSTLVSYLLAMSNVSRDYAFDGMAQPDDFLILRLKKK